MINVADIKNAVLNNFKDVSSDTVGWLAVLFVHCATIPPILGLLFGVSDKLPSIDVVLFLWTGLVLMFIRALLNKDTLNIVTISVGFMIQSALMGLLVFR